MSFNKQLPRVQALEKNEPNAFKLLWKAIQELQLNATDINDLISAGIARKAANGSIYNPSADESNPFDLTDDTVPDAPTGLSATATANMVFISWTIPDFQPLLSSSEVWILNAPSFREDISYVIDDFVTYSGTVYIFTSNHAAGAWNAGDVSAAGSGDLVISNAKDRYQTPINSAAISIDIEGGTVHLWVRLISLTGVAGAFSSSTAVTATAKDIPAHAYDPEIAARIELRI